MNKHKKNEIALYITSLLFFVGVGVLSGDYLKYTLMLGVFFGLIGCFCLAFKVISYLLEKIFPENNNVKR